MAKAGKALELHPTQGLQTGFEVDIELGGGVLILHGKGHVDLHAAERVGDVAQRLETQVSVTLNFESGQTLEGADQRLRSAVDVGPVDLAPAVPGDLNAGISRNAEQPNGFTRRLEPRDEQGIGESGVILGRGEVVAQVFGRDARNEVIDGLRGHFRPRSPARQRRNDRGEVGRHARQK